jgi:integrase/recombinase XerD
MFHYSFHFSFSLRRLHISLSGGSKRNNKVSFFINAEQEAKHCEEVRQYSTAKNYRTAIRSLRSFLQGHELMVRDVSPELMADYAQWLRQQGISMNTVSCYLRSLRAIYNKVVRRYGLEDLDPFKDLFTGHAKTVKRSASDEDIKRLQAMILPRHSVLQLSRDIFFFSLYAQGMPFVDVAFLRNEQIRDGLIVYERHKTGQQIVVKIEGCIQEIINRYSRTESDFVFPIITTHYPAQAYKQYQSKLRTYNRHLHQLEKIAGLKGSLTSYVVRHTWASLAYDTDIDLAVIASALGHTNTNTTRIYIRDINNRRLAEANHKVLNRIIP